MTDTDNIAGYRIESVAGHGGWSVVYRAVELATGRRVAVKVLAEDFRDRAEFRARFRQERRVASAVEHPNVIPLLEHDTDHLVMRWIDGSPLRDLLPVEPARAGRIAAQVGDALDALHAAGYVHRDVKPANVLIAQVGRAYLTDFGLAKELSADPGLTDSGRWLGTVGYAPPEQIRGEAPDERSDVYALGATLFHAVTGHLPYPRDDDTQTMNAHLNEPPPAHDSPLDPVVRRAMAKDPAARHGSAGELGRAALEAVS